MVAASECRACPFRAGEQVNPARSPEPSVKEPAQATPGETAPRPRRPEQAKSAPTLEAQILSSVGHAIVANDSKATSLIGTRRRSRSTAGGLGKWWAAMRGRSARPLSRKRTRRRSSQRSGKVRAGPGSSRCSGAMVRNFKVRWCARLCAMGGGVDWRREFYPRCHGKLNHLHGIRELGRRDCVETDDE